MKIMGTGYIDKCGGFVVPPVFDRDHLRIDFKEGVAWISKDKKWGLIDASGSFTLPRQYNDALDFHSVSNDSQSRAPAAAPDHVWL